MDNERNPWEVIEEENVANATETAIKKRRNARGKTATAWFLGIVKWFLLFSVVLTFVYTVFIHPVNKLKLRLFLGGSYTMVLKVYAGFSQEQSLATVKVDGNLVYVSYRGDRTYYEVDGETIYEYRKIDDGWEKVKTEENMIFFGDPDEDTLQMSVLLDRHNYERAKEKFFVHRIKKGVDIGEFDAVEIRRIGMEYGFDLYAGGAVGTLVFENIGRTHITPPWEE